MKTLHIGALLLLSLFTINFSFAQQNDAVTKKENIKVWGNCETCKKRIEKAALSAGAITALWNEETKMLAVSYDNSKTSSMKIQERIAAAGHDTQDAKATDQSYQHLPGCCQYDRAETTTTAQQCCSNLQCSKDAAACKEMNCCKDKNCCDKKAGATMMKCGEGMKKAACCKH